MGEKKRKENGGVRVDAGCNARSQRGKNQKRNPGSYTQHQKVKKIRETWEKGGLQWTTPKSLNQVTQRFI